MKGSRAQEQSEVGANAAFPNRCHVGPNEFDLHALGVHSLAGSLQGLVDEIDTRDLPASFRQLDGPDPAARAEVERRPVRRITPVFLFTKKLGELLGERTVTLRVLPGMKPDPIGELIVHRFLLEVRERGRQSSLSAIIASAGSYCRAALASSDIPARLLGRLAPSRVTSS